MSTVLIIAIVFGSIVAMQWIKMMGKERQEGGGSVGMSELEARMEEAVARAIEPLREQVAALEERVSGLDPDRQLTEGRRASHVEERHAE